MAWLNSSWLSRKKITIPASGVSSPLTDFPVYVDLSTLGSDFHTDVKSDGSDIRVTTDDGSTEVPLEVVSIDTTAETGELHFKAPSLSSSADTDFYIYYGNAAASAYGVADTYGRNNVWTEYGGVWHMGTSTLVDSTGNASNSSTNTGTNFASGKVGDATDYSGSSQRSIIPHNSAMDISTAGTWSMWANYDLVGRAMEKSDSYFMLQFSGAGHLGPLIKPNNSVANMGSLGSGTWFHLAGRFSYSGTGTLDAIKNGVIQGTTTSISSAVTTTTKDLYIGSDDGPNYFNGRIDEVRIAQQVLSVGWLAAEYTNQATPTTFYTIGLQEESTPNETNIYYFDGHGGISDPDNAWSDDANAFDGSTSTVATSTAASYGDTDNLIGIGTTATSSGGDITQVRARAHDGSSYSSWETLSSPSGDWSWGEVQNLYLWAYQMSMVGGIYVTIFDSTDTEELSNFSVGSGNTLSIVELEVTSEVSEVSDNTGAFFQFF